VAESSWPSPSNSRVVDDTQYEKIGIQLGPSGVYGDFTSPQLVFGDSSGMQVKIAADRYAMVRGHVWWSGSSIFTKSIAANASGSTRIDLVVLQLSRTTWDVTTVIVQGTPGGGAPTATQNLGTTGVYQVVLAQVSVASGAGSITAGNVTYMATHIGAGGQLRAPSVAALAYVPQPHPGMGVVLDTGDEYGRNAANSAWVIVRQVGPTSYTPTFTANGGGLVLGTGGIAEAEYTVINGKMCHYRGTVKFGTSGINIGSGQYLISLPFASSATLSTLYSAVGSFVARDSSGPTLLSGVTFVAASQTIASFINGTGGLVSNSSPFTWAINDALSWDVTYAIA